MKNDQNISIKRIEYIDKVKGFAMLCIIAGHLDALIIKKLVYPFHIPVFFIICGFFMKLEWRSLKSRILRLLIPYVFSVITVGLIVTAKQTVKMTIGHAMDLPGLMKVFLGYLEAGLYASGSTVNFFGIDVMPVGAVWFLPGMIWGCIFTVLIVRMSGWISERISAGKSGKKYAECLIAVTAAFMLWLAAYLTAGIIWLPLSIQSGCSSVIFITVGVYAKDLFLNRRMTLFYPAAFALFAAAMYFSIANDYMSIARSCFPDPAINILGAIAGTWLLIGFFRSFSCGAVGKQLAVFGKNSIVVLSVHYIEKNIIPWQKLAALLGDGIPAWSAVYVLKVAICFIGVILVGRVSLLKKIYSITD